MSCLHDRQKCPEDPLPSGTGVVQPAMCKCNQQSNQLTSHVSGGGMEFMFLGTKVRLCWMDSGRYGKADRFPRS